MKTPNIDWITTLCHNAGEIATKFLQTDYKVFSKGKKDIATQADFDVETYLVNQIHKNFPSHQILAEETFRDPIDLRQPAWIIDPIDGTHNFDNGLPYFGQSVAYVEAGQTHLACVSIPSLDMTFTAELHNGSYLNHTRLHIPQQSSLEQTVLLAECSPKHIKSANISFTHIQKLLPHIGQLRILGATALSLSFLGYIPHAAFLGKGHQPWDIAAGALIASEAGVLLSDYAGSSFGLSSKSLLAAHADTHSTMLEILEQS